MTIRLRFSALIATVLGTVPVAAGAQWVPQHSGTTASIRGFSVVDASVAWASGTRGTFLWTDDGGTTWHPGTVPGATSLDFRAVKALSLDTAYVMAAGQDTARIYRTTDRGAHWTLQYDDTSKGAFLDAIAFFDARHALALGDPMNGRFVVLETADGGAHWTRIPDAGLPPALPGEGAFAASGTSLVTCGARDAWFATGGAAVSRVFRSRDGGRTWTASETPVKAGSAPAGIFSLACLDQRVGIAAGGNYAHPDASAVTVALTYDGGATWRAVPPSAATGYLSGVAYVDAPRGSDLVGVGTNGTAMSHDGGHTWHQVDSLSLNVVAATRSGAHRVWAAGAGGRIVTLGGRDSTTHANIRP
jgi:photosystem II stability/assembly factor-like uncharacterized protein